MKQKSAHFQSRMIEQRKGNQPPIENPDEEVSTIHFMAIWELKEGKLYRGYQISQPSDEDPLNTDAYSRIKS